MVSKTYHVIAAVDSAELIALAAGIDRVSLRKSETGVWMGSFVKGQH